VSLLSGATEGLARGIMSGLDSLFTSDEERAEAELRLRTVLQQPHILQAMANVKAAEHPNWFVAGARPALLWVCAAGLAYQLVVRPLLAFGLQVGGGVRNGRRGRSATPGHCRPGAEPRHGDARFPRHRAPWPGAECERSKRQKV